MTEGPHRRLDHLVVAVRDLDGAAGFYERLGFQVGPRNRHPWGTENRIIQFPDAFLELIAVGQGADIPPHGPGRFSFGAFVRDSLASREGSAMLALASADAVSDAVAFAGAGLGTFEPFFFERRGRRADGADTRVAFTLAFARDPHAPEVGFFVCQQHEPDNFWNAALQRHPNGAAGLAAVALAANDPPAHRTFLEGFVGGPAVGMAGKGLSIALGPSRLDVLTPAAVAGLYGSDEAQPQPPRLVGFAVRVLDLSCVAASLDAARICHQQVGARLIVPSRAAFGVAIAFEPA